MVDASIQSQLSAILQDLEVAQQRQVLEFALNLRSQPLVGVPGSSLLRFAGKIDEADLNSMSSAIEEGCEKVVMVESR
jgi:hypothetical protein